MHCFLGGPVLATFDVSGALSTATARLERVCGLDTAATPQYRRLRPLVRSLDMHGLEVVGKFKSPVDAPPGATTRTAYGSPWVAM
jgi:hypothetical protein